MKNLVFAFVMVLTGISFVSVPLLRAQDSISIKDPAEFNAYQTASTQTDPAAKAAALESFLQAYPQTPVKNSILDILIQTYEQLNQPAQILSAATRLLQVDPTNVQAILVSVHVKKAQCGQNLDASGVSTDPQICDDSAALAQEGLTVAEPASMADADWKSLTGLAYPVFHSAIAFDDMASKKDFAGAIKEYTAELMLYPPDACTKPGPCLADTLQLAQAYAKPGDSRDEVRAVWFFARAWDFAPPAYKVQIEPQLEYWYNKYHGAMDGLDEIKMQSAATVFPPGTQEDQQAAHPASSLASAQAPPPLPDIAPPPQPPDAPPPTISLGQTMDQVTAGFGQPLRVAKLGTKTIFYYKDMKVTFTNGKVSDVE